MVKLLLVPIFLNEDDLSLSFSFVAGRYIDRVVATPIRFFETRCRLMLHDIELPIGPISDMVASNIHDMLELPFWQKYPVKFRCS